MRWTAVWAVAWRDLRVVSRSKPVLLPIVIVPVVMLVLIPVAVGIGIRQVPIDSPDLGELTVVLERLPDLAAQLAGFELRQQVMLLALVYFVAPLFLIMPLMVASVIAADSFAGERERKTLEALLHTPTTDRELLVGKLAAALLPAVGVTVLGFVVYSIVANVVAWPVMGRLILPNGLWWLLAFWLGPAVAGLGLGITVIVSARAKSFQEAFQIGGILVIPVVALVIGQVLGVMYLSVGLVAVAGLVLWLIDLAILRAASQHLTRGALFARL